jgi:hypothetical protein
MSQSLFVFIISIVNSDHFFDTIFRRCFWMKVNKNHWLKPLLSGNEDKIESEVYDEFLSTELLNQNNIQEGGIYLLLCAVKF